MRIRIGLNDQYIFSVGGFDKSVIQWETKDWGQENMSDNTNIEIKEKVVKRGKDKFAKNDGG